MVDQAMGSMLGHGSVSALTYGNKIAALILTIGTMALGTAVLPYFSQMVAAADWKTVRHTLKSYTGLILVVTLPITFLVVLFSKPLVALLFQRGNFTAG